MSAARIPRLLVPTKLSNFRLIPSASSATRRWASAAAAAPPPTSAKAKRQGKTSGVSTGGSSGGSGIKRVHGVRVYDHLPPGWNMRIGIETHAQIKTREKLFSPATLKPFRPPVAPSTTIAPFDAALPGTLPRINPVAVELALRACLALECNVAPEARFDRKHYFYRDLPSGYQITMKYKPLAQEGMLKLRFDDGQLPYAEDEVDVGIEQLQIEQDTARTYRVLLDSATIDPSQAGATTEEVRVDLNRAGVGLMEIVGKPDMWKPEQAGAYVRKLQSVLRRVGASDGNMEAGSMRCDVNVSVHRDGEPSTGGARAEIKNVISARFIMNAIAYEAARQVAVIEGGGKVVNETRGYDEAKGETYSLRTKGGAEDYRYMPDPNLAEVRTTAADLEAVRRSLPELPDQLRERLVKQYDISTHNANALLRFDDESLVAREQEIERGTGQVVQANEVLTSLPVTAVGMLEELAPGRTPQIVANWIVNEVAKNLGERLFYQSPLNTSHLGELIDLQTSKHVSPTVARGVLADLLAETPPPDVQALVLQRVCSNNPILDLLTARNLLMLDADELEALCHTVVRDLAGIVDQAHKKGTVEKIVPRLVGEVMKRARGRADAEASKALLGRLVQAPPSDQ